MGNDIEIRVRVANDTAGGLTAVNASLRGLKDRARDAGQSLDGLATRSLAAAAALQALDNAAKDAGRSLRTLRGRASAADAALRDLRDGTNNAGNSMRTLNTRTATANTRLGDLGDRTRTLRSDTDDLDGSMRRLTGTMGGLRGSLGTVRTAAGPGSGGAGGALEELKGAALLLAPALLPVAASLAPIAAGAGAAGIAMGVFGAAVMGQLVAVKGATDAQKKYDDAVQRFGRGSQQAAQAQMEVSRTLAGMPAATQRAAAAVGVLKEQYQQWSKSLAGNTMPVVTKGMAVLGSLFPKLTPVVKGASEQMSRFVTILAGGINSSGFDKFMESFAKFSTGALSKANDAIVHFTRTMSGDTGSSQLTEFMAYAHRVGPAVGQTLANLAKALVHLVAAASETGVSMLSLVNAFARLVNAIPTSLLSTMLQAYAGFKLLKLGIAGVSAATSAGVITRLSAFSRAARFGGVGSAISGVVQRMSTLQKVGGALGVLGVVAVGIDALAKKARGAPPDVDKLTTSLKSLASTGKFSGELKKTFGDMDGFVAKLNAMKKGQSNLDSAMKWPRIAGLGPVIDAVVPRIDDLVNKGHSIGALKDDFASFDQSMADFASGGHAKEAATQFKEFEAVLKANGYTQKQINALFPEYTNFVADARHEQELTAQSMGIFGEAAQAAGAKLDAQKSAADGLRASLIALNDVNRSAYDGQIAFEAGLDGLAEAFKKNGATLDLNTEAGRANGTAMSQAAKAQDEMIASGLAAGDSFASMTEKSSTLRAEMTKLATEAFKGNKEKAQEYVNTLLGVPSEIKTLIKAEKAEAVAGLNEVEAAIRKTPGAKSVTVSTLNGAAIKALEAVGFKTKQLPDGRTMVYTANGKSLGSIAAVARAMNALNGKTATTWTYHNIRTNYSTSHSVSGGKSVHEMVGSANGNIFRGRAYANGGMENHVAEIAQPSMRLWAEPETGGEAYIPLAEAKRPRSLSVLSDVAKRFGYRLDKFAKGGLTKAQKRAKAQAEAESQARHDANSQLTISHFGQMAGYQRSEFGSALGKPDSVGSLVNALNQWRGIIQKSTHGGTESKLLKQLDATGRALLKQEKQLNAVTASLGKAKDKLNDLKSSAASLSSSVRGGVLSSANITRGAGGDKTMTVASIMGNATQSRDKAKAFAQALKELKAKGLDKGLIEDIANAGIEGGGLETAGALMGASSSEISSLNTLRSQTATYAKSAGGTAADAVYGAAIKAQTAVVKMLTKSQDSLKKSMDKLAKAMEKAIEQAFKKKANGGIVGGAASGGLRGGLTWVGEEGPELVRLPASSTVYPAGQSRQIAASAWASMLNEPRRPSYSAAAGGGQQTVNVTLEVHSPGGRSNRFEAFLLEEIQRMVRARGGNVQQILSPPRGR
jgi:hypothetical protein